MHRTLESGGVVRTIAEEDGKLILDHRQDITAGLEHAQRLRNDDDVWKKGVKNSWVAALHIPTGVVHELLGVGVNVYTCSNKDLKWGLQRIGRWEVCQTTRKNLF
jgi:hypothetical protein